MGITRGTHKGAVGPLLGGINDPITELQRGGGLGYTEIHNRRKNGLTPVPMSKHRFGVFPLKSMKLIACFALSMSAWSMHHLRCNGG